jgi:hypothetical protein
MAKRPRSSGRRTTPPKGGLVLDLKMTAIKHDAQASIALLKKATWAETKGGKTQAIKKLDSVLKTMNSLCPSMGFKIGFE